MYIFIYLHVGKTPECRPSLRRYTKEQVAVLAGALAIDPHVGKGSIKELVKKTNLSEIQVFQWICRKRSDIKHGKRGQTKFPREPTLCTCTCICLLCKQVDCFLTCNTKKYY